ncbi:MAG: hypothetical protein ABIF88_03975 [archaeon]
MVMDNETACKESQGLIKALVLGAGAVFGGIVLISGVGNKLCRIHQADYFKQRDLTELIFRDPCYADMTGNNNGQLEYFEMADAYSRMGLRDEVVSRETLMPYIGVENLERAVESYVAELGERKAE